MQAYVIQNEFGLANLTQIERPMPEPDAHEVVLKVRACSLNYRDHLMLEGLYNPRQALPLVPLSDGAGEIVALGEQVRRYQIGDRVAGLFCQHWQGGAPDRERLRVTLGGPLDGMLQQYIALPEQGVIDFPEHLSYPEAATLPCAALTAWVALTKYRQVKAGDTVLILGTGGVAIFALQFAKLFGARVIITSSSDQRLEQVAQLGADELINYRTTPDWHRIALTMTNKQGVDHIIEVGGADTLEKSLAAVKVGGFIAVIGVLSGQKTPLSVIPILMSSLTLQGITVGNRDDFAAMNQAIYQHQLKPIIDQRFTLDEAQTAFARLATGGHLGKLIITVE